MKQGATVGKVSRYYIDSKESTFGAWVTVGQFAGLSKAKRSLAKIKPIYAALDKGSKPNRAFRIRNQFDKILYDDIQTHPQPR